MVTPTSDDVGTLHSQLSPGRGRPGCSVYLVLILWPKSDLCQAEFELFVRICPARMAAEITSNSAAAVRLEKPGLCRGESAGVPECRLDSPPLARPGWPASARQQFMAVSQFSA